MAAEETLPTSSPIERKKHANDRVPLHVISREIGLDGLLQMVHDEVESMGWSEEDKVLADKACRDMVRTHEGMYRDDGQAYASHPARNFLRHVTPERLGIRDQPALSIAILLHDIVEDDPWKFLEISSDVPRDEAQQRALEQIWDEYSPDIAIYVALFTIPPYPREDLTQDEKFAHHLKHRQMILELDLMIGTGILTDIIDNGMANEHETSQERHEKQMRKYIPELPLYEAFVTRNREMFSEAALQYIDEVFSNVRREHRLWQQSQARQDDRQAC